MAKMREVNKKSKTVAKVAAYTFAKVEIDGQIVMMKVCKPVLAPKGLTARCQG